MINGHGDDLYRFGGVRINFSSNIYSHFDHSGLFRFLSGRLGGIANYPEPVPYSLEKELAARHGTAAENVLAANGATEAIYLIAGAWQGAKSLILKPTFSEYADACRMHGHEVYGIRDVCEIRNARSLAWICNPNNPTGAVIDKRRLLSLARDCPHVLFVFDQSYWAYTAKETVDASEAVAMPNVVLIYSMTKDYAVPGLRIGYMVANAGIISMVGRRRMPWSVNQLAVEAGKYLLAHSGDYHIDAAVLCEERRRVAGRLDELGVATYPSDSNILLCRLPFGTAGSLKQRLAERYGILIRDAGNFDGLDARHFRIAVQTAEDDDDLLKAINEILTDDK